MLLFEQVDKGRHSTIRSPDCYSIMGKVFVLKSVQRVPADMEKVWQFFSNPANLFVMTPPSLNLKNTNQQIFDAMYPGQVITYWVRPILGIPLFWLTEITHVEHHRFFVDEQRK